MCVLWIVGHFDEVKRGRVLQRKASRDALAAPGSLEPQKVLQRFSVEKRDAFELDAAKLPFESTHVASKSARDALLDSLYFEPWSAAHHAYVGVQAVELRQAWKFRRESGVSRNSPKIERIPIADARNCPP